MSTGSCNFFVVFHPALASRGFSLPAELPCRNPPRNFKTPGCEWNHRKKRTSGYVEPHRKRDVKWMRRANSDVKDVRESGTPSSDDTSSLNLPKGWADPSPDNIVALLLTFALGVGILLVLNKLLIGLLLIILDAIKYFVLAVVLVFFVILLL